MAFENVVASPYPQDRTVVVLTDDGSLSTAPIAANFSGEVYVYVGTKTTHGHPVEQAGLTNGTLSGIVQRAAMARAIRSGVIGSSVRRTPAASSMALAMAAGAGTMGGSPTPRAPNGPAGDGFSTMMHSMFGRSAAVSLR